LVRVISCFWRRVFVRLGSNGAACDALLPLESSAYKCIDV
jgi:hypothetical protein